MYDRNLAAIAGDAKSFMEKPFEFHPSWGSVKVDANAIWREFKPKWIPVESLYAHC